MIKFVCKIAAFILACYIIVKLGGWLIHTFLPDVWNFICGIFTGQICGIFWSVVIIIAFVTLIKHFVS